MNKKILLFMFVFALISFADLSIAQIKMNEIYSRGTTSDPDWIEIYNTTSSEVNLTGYKIYDNGGLAGTKPKKSFPSGTIIPAYGFYVIVTDDSDSSGFGLSSSGEEVWLENSSGVVIDDVTFPALQTTESYARVPDGGTLQIVTSITKGYSNVTVNNIVMNEIFSRGTTTDPDWIEIFNKSTVGINISGYKIYDVGGQGGTKPKKVFPAGTTIPANGYVVIVVDDSDSSGFGLSSSGEKVWLENTSGVIIDSITFPALQTNESYSRIPDGGTWKVTTTITRGTTNIYSTNASIVMNEIFSRGTTTDPDWIEIYNLTNSAVTLTGYKIYDVGGQGGTKPKKVFPSGTTIPAKGFYVIVTDDADSSGFGLSSSGEQVWLEDATGSVIDDVTFPALQTTESYGRFPDGTGTWRILSTISKGTANIFTSIEDENQIVNNYSLAQNYPNPFNPSTTIQYQIPQREFVTIKVFNTLGKEVATLVNEIKNAGVYEIKLNADNLDSGVYFYQIKAGDYLNTRKLILMK